MRSFVTRTPARAIVALVLVLVTSVLVVRATDLVGGPVEPTESPTPTAELAEATATPAGAPTEAPTATPSPTAEPTPTFKLNGGGAKNIVIAKNQQDGRFLVRGRLDLNRVGAPRLAPVNIAYAMGLNCTGCNTLAVAGQIILYKRGGTLAAPQNAAVAVNAGCTGCFTGAWAIQYFVPVDDLGGDMPKSADQLVRALDAKLRDIERRAANGEVTLNDALMELDFSADSVLGQFRAEGDKLYQQSKIETNADTPSPYPSPPPEPSESPSATPADVTEPTPTSTP